jgi:hypothetical protein
MNNMKSSLPVNLRVLIAISILAVFGSCATEMNKAQGSKLKKHGQVVTFELLVPKSTNLSSRTKIFLLTDGAICGTNLKALKRKTDHACTIYSGSLNTYSGTKRYFIVHPPNETAQVFILVTSTTPDGLDWIPCPKPDFIDRSDDPAWSLNNGINDDQRSRDLPPVIFKLRYNVVQVEFP